MDDFTPDLFLVIGLVHREGDNGDGDSGLLVDCLRGSLPPLASHIPLEAWRRVSTTGHALHLHFRARSGHQRSRKWWRISWEPQVDRTWRGWKYYSWGYIWYSSCPPIVLLSGVLQVRLRKWYFGGNLWSLVFLWHLGTVAQCICIGNDKLVVENKNWGEQWTLLIKQKVSYFLCKCPNFQTQIFELDGALSECFQL